MKLIKIKKIEFVPYIGKVYDLEVKSTKSYNVFNIIVHNSICTTRYMTGFHLPTLQSVYESQESNVPIIADGGAKYYGDIAKALTFGATMVMSGGWFASCIDSPAKIVGGKKLYRGSTSYESKGQRKHIEGRQIELEEGLTYAERMEEIKQSLSSAISYAGGTNLEAFNFVDWGLVYPD